MFREIGRMEDGKVDGMLARADDRMIERLARGITEVNPGITVLKAPQIGLVMMRAQEAVENAGFNLGELLVTECTVTRGEGEVGWGLCLGENPDRAFHLAVLDLAWEHIPEQRRELEAALTAIAAHVRHEDAVLSASVDRTRVRFEVPGDA